MDYTIDPGNPLGQRITNLVLDNGQAVEAGTRYTVAGCATVNRTADGRLISNLVREYTLAKKNKDNALRLPKTNNPEIAGYPGKAS